MTQTIYNALVTPDGTLLESLHRWDYRTHLDTVSGEFYMIDGGNETCYRTSVNVVPAEIIQITTDDPHYVKREYFTWGSYGREGNEEKQYIKLKDLSSEHIKNILLTQLRIKGSYVEDLMKSELEYRAEQLKNVSPTKETK